MAISALALAIGQQFVPYMQHLIGPLKAALENTDDYPVCAAAVGVVGDLSRALEKQFSPHCEEIFIRLMQLLMNQLLHRSVKPPILSTFGDIALAIGADFARFLEHAMTMLHNASQIQIDMSDPDDAEYMHKLRENILEGYSGIIQALRDADKQEPAKGGVYCQGVMQYLPNIVYLLENRINAEEQKDEDVLKAASGLLGDIAQAIPAAKQHFQGQWVRDMLQSAKNMGVDDEDIQFAARILP